MPDDPKPRFFVDPSWWLDAIQKVGVPTAILIAAGFGIRAVYIDIVVPAWNRTDKHIEIQDQVSIDRESQFKQQTKVLKGQHQLQQDQAELSANQYALQKEIAKALKVEYVVAKKVTEEPKEESDTQPVDPPDE